MRRKTDKSEKKTEAGAKVVPADREGKSRPSTALPIVGLGASAGGLEAFAAFFTAMPVDAGIAFVLVSHLDPTHVSIMPELIQKHTTMHVLQIKDGMRVEPDTVYVVPPNQDLSILNGVLQLMKQSKPRGANNLPIDGFLLSLASDQGPNAAAIIFSGTGNDGTLGVKAIKAEAGMVMVQDEESAKYDGMPRSAIATGLADYILPPAAMPEQLIKYLQHAVHTTTARILADSAKIPDSLQKIYILLRNHSGHDFSFYKKNTILRRIERRMHVHQIDTIKDYVLYLQKSAVELDILFKELLIGVTSFFRDAQAFEKLRENLRELLGDKPEDYTLRVWVAGCSSGEETYSIAILLQEVMEELGRRINVQIFGTDIDPDAVNAARAGIFPDSIAGGVSEARLKRWFSKEENHYRVKKSIREMLVFAVQSIIKDPPFTKLDLLCCRNLLIYLGPEIQKRLISIFHYSLKPDGILFLGSSESIGQAHDLFAVLDKKWKIHRRKPAPFVGRPGMTFPAAPAIPENVRLAQPETIRKTEELSAFQLVETILRQVDAPPCVVIDEANNIVYLHGRTGRYLEPVIGKISVNILEMARPGLKMDLATAIRGAATNKKECVRNGVAIEQNGGHLSIDLTVKPVLGHSALRGMMMVIFKETTPPAKRESPKKQGKGRTKDTSVETLEQELRYTRENLQTTIEELETSNEELKSANEELQSTNEELQSTNEELETSKEELQSLNEEASTVNAELQSRLDELSTTNDDMKNLLDNTHIATIFLDLNLCVRRFTPKAVEIIPLAAIDSGRPISNFATSLIDTDLAADAQDVLQDLGMREKEVRSKDGACYRMRVRPYRTVNNVIDGVVFTFEDITVLKQTESTLNTLNVKLEQRERERAMRPGIAGAGKTKSGS
jgi:two-component system CheB/CheR fusion protein